MTEHRERVLRIERTFDAPVERVFEAWTSEEVLRRSLHGMPGWETPTDEVDLRVRGRIRIVIIGGIGLYKGAVNKAERRSTRVLNDLRAPSRRFVQTNQAFLATPDHEVRHLKA